jgi:hypothetical protein
MASNDNSNKQPTSTSTSTSKPSNSSDSKSQYRTIKDAGFDNMNQFMNSYGLKMYNHEDVQEAKAILEGYKRIDEVARKK